MKKFVNRPENAVEEMLQGLAVLRPGLMRLSGHKVMLRADAEQIRHEQIAVISGGGSGHEPAHAGYIGAGMLSAGVAGEVFTSPDTDSVLAAIQAVAGKPGALLVVKNYTGDRPSVLLIQPFYQTNVRVEPLKLTVKEENIRSTSSPIRPEACTSPSS